MTTPAPPPPALKPTKRPEGWWSYPLMYAVLVYLIGFVPNVTWWGWVLAGLALGVCGGLAALRVLSWFSDAVGNAAGLCGLFAGWMAGVFWLLYAPHPSAHWQWLLICLIVFGGWYTVVLWWAPHATHRPEMVGVQGSSPYAAVFERAGLDGVKVVDVKRSPSGGVETVVLQSLPAAGPNRKRIRYAHVKGAAEQIAVEAVDLMRSRGIDDFQEDDVITEPGKNAQEHLVHFTVKRVLKGDVPYVPAFAPSKSTVRHVIGQYEDDTPLEIQLCDEREGARHVDIVGRTGGGKGVLIADIIAAATRSDESEVWVIGVEKLVKLTWGWCLPWLRGEVDRPTIDWVAGEDEDEAYKALEDALHFTKLCNAGSPTTAARVPSRGKAHLVLVFDECSKFLHRARKWACWDGRRLTASEMVAEIRSLGRTGPVSVVLANQDMLFGSFGNAGPSMHRNGGIGIALPVLRRDDADKLMAGLPATVNAAKLRDHTMYVRSGTDEERVMKAKAQSLLDEEIPIVAARHAQWRYGLDPTLTSQLRFYGDRWNPVHHRAMIEAATAQGLEWPVAPADDARQPSRPGDTPGDAHRAPAGDGPGDTRSPAGELALPDGWDANAERWDDSDIWAALTQAGDGSDLQRPGRRPVGDQAGDGGGSSAGGHLPPPDTTKIAAAGRRFIDAYRRAHQSPPLADPLGAILRVLADPRAPQDWVPTWRLAINIGRVSKDAAPRDVVRAATLLGKEINLQTGLVSKALPREIDQRRPNGYRVADLKAAGERLREAG